MAAQAPDRADVVPAAGVAGVVVGGFGDEWGSPHPGASLHLEVPGYGGSVRLALTAVDFEDRTGVLPEFTFLAATLGWGPRLRLPGGATASAGPLVGAVQMRFAPGDLGFEGNLRNETEAVVGAVAGVRVPVAGRVALWADAEVMRVALAAPRMLAVASGGVAVRLDAPAWLRRLAE